MKKLLLALTAILMLNSAPFVSAAIRSIVDTENTSGSTDEDYGNYSTGDESYTVDYEQQCVNAGYGRTGCPAGYITADPCPYTYGYYRDCCPEEYRYQQSDCINHGMKAVDSCGGFYKCE